MKRPDSWVYCGGCRATGKTSDGQPCKMCDGKGVILTNGVGYKLGSIHPLHPDHPQYNKSPGECQK